MVEPQVVLLIAAVLLLLILMTIVIFIPRRKHSLCYGASLNASCPTPQITDSVNIGGYSFIANGFDDYDILEPLIDDLMDNKNIRDFQFYDWFSNYSGKNTFDTQSPSSASPVYLENWWNCDTWKDAYMVSRVISRNVIFQAIQQIHTKGGRAWAYVQAQASEDLHLADKGSKTPGIVQLGNSFRHGGDGSMVGGYLQNAALAEFQCNAWMQPVLDLGFFGIHWDLFDDTPHPKESLDFIQTANGILKKNCLYQTFNDINLYQNISNSKDSNYFGNPLEDGLLFFPYAEVWSDPISQDYVTNHAANAVVMAYPASCIYGVPPPKDRSCSPPFCTSQQEIVCCDDIYNPSPSANCTTPWELADLRITKYTGLTPSMRYCIYGIGQQDGTTNIIVGMMRSEYFPIVYPLKP